MSKVEGRMTVFCRFKMIERSDIHNLSFVIRQSSFPSAVDICRRICDIAFLNFFIPNLFVTLQPEVLHGK